MTLLPVLQTMQQLCYTQILTLAHHPGHLLMCIQHASLLMVVRSCALAREEKWSHWIHCPQQLPGVLQRACSAALELPNPGWCPFQLHQQLLALCSSAAVGRCSFPT